MDRSPAVAWGCAGLRHLLHVARRATRAAPPAERILPPCAAAPMGSPEEPSSRNNPSSRHSSAPSELYEYCSKAVPFISASFQGAPNLLHIHFHLTIPLNYLNSPSQKWSPSIITPSSEVHMEFGDLQIHSTSSHWCRAEGFLCLPSLLPSSLALGHIHRGFKPWKPQCQGRA